MPNRLENAVGPTFLGIGYKEHMALDNSRPPEGKTYNKKLPPHGVDPKTYSFLLTAIDYNKSVKNIFDKIDPVTMELIIHYYFTEASIRELPTVIIEGYRNQTGSRTTLTKRILNGLDTMWEQLPPEIRPPHPKEKVIKIKEDSSKSPKFAEEKRKAAITLWQDEEYRQKTLQGIRKRKYDPHFIQKMKKISQGRSSPMEGKNHTQETIERIRKASQKTWVTRRFLKDNLGIDTAQRTAEGKRLYDEDNMRIIRPTINQAVSFLNELQENPYNIVHSHVSERDIKKTVLSIITDMQKIFSTSSTDELKKRTTELDKRLETVKNQLRKKEAEIFAIGNNERSMWEQIKENNLETKILQTGQITQQELNMIRDYFEKKITREGLTITMFNRFTIAVARVIP